MAVTHKALLGRGFIRVSVAEQGPTPRKHRTAYSVAAKKTWLETGGFHTKAHIPDRFTEKGAREFGFRKRTPKYNARKKRVFGHMLPNVWSGVSEKRSERGRNTANRTGVRIRYNVPALNFGSGAKELRTSNQREADSIAKFYASQYEQQLMKETR